MTNSIKNFRSCFISASPNMKLDLLFELFYERQIEITNLSFTKQLSVINLIESAIKKSDFFCAYLDTTASANVIFEIGIAYSLRKPIFLIIGKEINLPLFMKDFFYLRAEPNDIDAIKFNLDNFLGHPQKRSSSKYVHSIGPSFSKIHVDKELSTIKNNKNQALGSRLRDVIADLLRNNNWIIAEEKGNFGKGPDLAFWLEEGGSIGNLVLVEIKTGSISEKKLAEAEIQLTNYLLKINAQVGLIIYSDTSGRIFPNNRSNWPIILRLDIKEFTELLTTNQLISRIFLERNRTSHGQVD